MRVQPRNRMRENCTSGSARGAPGNRRSYRGGLLEVRLSMKDEIEDRFAVLLGQGEHLMQCLPRDQHGLEHFVASEDVPTYQAWLTSAANLIRLVARPESHFVTECDRLLPDRSMQNGIGTLVIQKMYGLLSSTREEWNHGLLSPDYSPTLKIDRRK